jgi:hypothetical protein
MKKETGFLVVCCILFFGVFCLASGPAVEAPKTPHHVPKLTGKVKIDGVLDEPVWQEALVRTLDYEVEPGENIKPPVKTEVLLFYGEKHLYAAFRAYDPKPGEIRAHVTDRDNISGDDYVGIVLDTFNDSRRAFVFQCNPFGIQADFITTMMAEQDEWDGIWKSAGKIFDWGYAVEIKVPFTSLRFQKARDNQVWGFDAVRGYPRNLTRLIGLFPRDRSNNCYMCQADKVSGFKGARPGINVEIAPTLSALITQERESFPEGDFKEVNKKVDPGISARWSITPNLTLNAAVNPDFSQVEADAAQLDINNQFALFYPEKRPFFVEGISFFRSRFYAIYTRSVADPHWGVKLTGKEGKNAIGFFSVQDNLTNLWFPGSETYQATSLDMNNFSTVLRYRRDIGRSSNMGFLITDREGDDYYNRVAGIDGDFRFTKKDRIFWQYLGSQTRYPGSVVSDFNQPGGKFSGGAFDALYQHRTQHVYIFAHYQDITPTFRADLGFVSQSGVRLYEAGAGYTWRRNPGHWFTSLQLIGGYWYLTNSDGDMLEDLFYSMLFFYGPVQSVINAHAIFGKRTFLGREFDSNSVEFTARITPSGSLSLWVGGAFGDQVDFTNIQPGERVRVNPGIQYNMGKRLSLSLDHVYERLNVEGGELYTANLSNLRFVYQFSSRAFLRTILQYADYRYNTGLYPIPLDPEFKHLFSQVLFSYKINPQTVLFLGYSDDYYGYSMIPVTQNNRTFFLKIGYALVL